MAFDERGRAIRTAYASNIFAPQPRYLIEFAVGSSPALGRPESFRRPYGLAIVLLLIHGPRRARGAGAASAPGAADPTAPELAPALQQKYDGIKDFSADFTHAYEGGVLRKQITERGRLLVKKPGKMRWDYTAPEPKLFVSDGVKICLLHPAGQAGHRRDGPARRSGDDADAVSRRQRAT